MPAARTVRADDVGCPALLADEAAGSRCGDPEDVSFAADEDVAARPFATLLTRLCVLAASPAESVNPEARDRSDRDNRRRQDAPHLEGAEQGRRRAAAPAP